MENIKFNIETFQCTRCDLDCKTQTRYDKHIAACDYEPDEPYEMPAVKHRTADELYKAYMPTQQDYDQMNAVSKKSDKEYKCECGMECSKLFNLKRHQLNCKFGKNKEQENDKRIISDLRAQLAIKDSQLAMKDNEIELLKQQLAKPPSNPVCSNFIKSESELQPSIKPVVVKKMKPEDFLLENINKAYDARDFMDNMEVTEYDILESNKSDPVEWFVNIIDRNIKNKCKTVEEYPFHSIIDSNTHKRLMYVKVKDDKKKINEWSCEDEDIDAMLRSARIALTRKLMEINKREEADILDYLQKSHIPEYDDFNREIIKDWKWVKKENETTELITNIKLMISYLSDKTKAIMKIMTEKYPI